MTADEKVQLLINALEELMNQATFPAWAGESCRSCPRAHDGGCRDPHDDDCPYWKAYDGARKAVDEARRA